MSHIIITVAVVQPQQSPEGKSLTVPAIPFLHIGKSPLSSDRPHLPKLQKKNEAEIWKLRMNCRFQSGSFLSLESWTLHISWINYPFLMANLVCQAIYLHFPIMLSPIYKPLSQLGTLILNWKRTRSIAIYCKKKCEKLVLKEHHHNEQLPPFPLLSFTISGLGGPLISKRFVGYLWFGCF